jgi:hypothetical protein
MADYKFLHTRDIDRVLINGTIRISSLAHYRQMEREQWIADRLEGRSEVNVDHWKYHVDEAGSFAPEGYQVPVFADASSTLVITDSIIQYRLPDPEPFIFCASRGELRTLASAMCEGTDPYDACLRIGDITRLAHRMLHRGIVIELDNIRMHQIFADFRVSQVTYEDLSRDQERRPPPSPSPFRKHFEFAPQSEVRIAFRPHSPIPVQMLTVKTHRLKTLLAEEFRDRQSQTSTSSNTQCSSP